MNEIGSVEMEQVSGGAVGGVKRDPPGFPPPMPSPFPTFPQFPPSPVPSPGPNLPIVWGD